MRANSRKPARQSPRGATAGLDRLDQERAASLADEGGVSAVVENEETAKPLHVVRRRSRSEPSRRDMLFAICIVPLGEIHLSEGLAEVLALVEASGLSYRLGPGSTCIEGTWDEVMPVIRTCHERAREASPHVITLVQIEDDAGQRDKIRRNVESVEAKAGHPLERDPD